MYGCRTLFLMLAKNMSFGLQRRVVWWKVTEGQYRLHLQKWRVSQKRNQHEIGSMFIFKTWRWKWYDLPKCIDFHRTLRLYILEYRCENLTFDVKFWILAAESFCFCIRLEWCGCKGCLYLLKVTICSRVQKRGNIKKCGWIGGELQGLGSHHTWQVDSWRRQTWRGLVTHGELTNWRWSFGEEKHKRTW